MARVRAKKHEKPFWLFALLPVLVVLALFVFVLYKLQFSLSASFFILFFVALLSYLRIRQYFETVIFDKHMIYTPRAGWFYWREIKNAYIKEVPSMLFGKQKCIFFDLYNHNMYDTPLYQQWHMYMIPIKEMAICESESDIPLENMLDKIKTHLKK